MKKGRKIRSAIWMLRFLGTSFSIKATPSLDSNCNYPLVTPASGSAGIAALAPNTNLQFCRAVGIFSIIMGCGLEPKMPTPLKTENNVFDRIESHTHSHSSHDSTRYTPVSQLTNLNIIFGDMVFAATVDEIGNVRILEYPSEWRGKIKLLRFDGSSTHPPFSQDDCETIKNMAIQGFGPIVRSAYHSLLAVEIPPFLSSDFMDAIRKSAEEAGIRLSAYHLTNPVDITNSTMELKLGSSAISHIIGNMECIEDQVHLGQRGVVKSSFEKHLLVSSADILCDLAHNQARITMTYAIKNENKVIKVVYEHMEITPK